MNEFPPDDNISTTTPIMCRKSDEIRRPAFERPEVPSTRIQIIGGPGCGMSRLLERLVQDDITRRGAPVVLDPHGGLVEQACARSRDSGL